MRMILAVLMTTMILLPIQASAATGLYWDYARYDSDGIPVEGGVIGHSTPWNLSSDNATEYSFTQAVEDMPTIVEVYTATWCTNCVTTQDVMNEVIADSDAELIHYHSHWFDSLDPFGSDSAEERWESKYGHASALRLSPRDAPTKVVDGERFHWGTRPSSESLASDYEASFFRGSTAPLSGNFSFSILQSPNSLMVGWNLSSISSHAPTEVSIEPWLLLVEDSSYYPDGTNGMQYYEHILLEAILLESLSQNYGSATVNLPSLWDGDDLKLVILLDWVIPNQVSDSILPAPGILLLLTSLVAMSSIRRPRTL
tara:strand:+ start:573 stop:1511 length:939 start_codon:yes stop_codon:yes gene_type:complete